MWINYLFMLCFIWMFGHERSNNPASEKINLQESKLNPGKSISSDESSEKENLITDTEPDRKHWKKIKPYFSPPKEFMGIYGNYRSPMLKEDGSLVGNPSEWELRRKEIMDKWHGFMGKWPDFIQNPEYEVLEVSDREGLTQKKIRFSWVPGEITEGYLLIPQKAVNRPAVITVYYEPETAAGLGRPDLADRDFAFQLAKRGFVTLSLGTKENSLNNTYSIYYPSINNAEVEPLSMLAYAAANSWYLLADLPEVNKEKIGITGHSYGGKWAMFASCLFEKFAAAAWSDPGIVFEQDKPNINYWEPWYLGYHPPPWRKRGIPDSSNPATGVYPQLLEAGMDLHELHALMAPRPFLVSGGAEDPLERWIPLNHSVHINRLLGYESRVGMTNRPDHAPNPESNELIYAFFEHFLQ